MAFKDIVLSHNAAQLLIIWFPNKSGPFTLFRIKPEVTVGQVFHISVFLLLNSKFRSYLRFPYKTNALSFKAPQRSIMGGVTGASNYFS